MADARIELAGSAAFGLTNGGTQDFTIPGFGTPKAVIVFYSNSDDGLGFANGAVGMGFSDGTNEYSIQGYTRDNKAAGSSVRSLDNQLVHLTSTAGNEYAAFSFDSWVTDGVRIVSNRAHSLDRMMAVILIGGTDVAECAVGTHAIAAGTNHYAVGSGFQASLLFSLDARRTISASKWSVNCLLSMGIAHDNGTSVDQRSIYTFDDDNATPTAITQSLSETNLHHTYNISNATLEATHVDSFSSTGVNYTKTAATTTYDYPYLAIRFTNNPDVKLYTETIPVATGSQSSTAAGFEPTSVFFLESHKTAAGASTQDMAFGIASMNAASIASIGVSSQDGVATTNTRGHGSTTSIKVKKPNDTIRFEATLTSMDASGYTLDVTTAEATARKWVALAIGAGGSASYSITGASDVAITPAASTLQFNQNPSLSGAVSIDVGSAATVLDYNQRPEFFGGAAITIAPAAASDYTQNLSISGDASILITPEASALALNQHPALLGDMTVSFTAAASMLYSSGNSIAGDVTILVGSNAGTEYARHYVLAGQSSIALVSDSALVYSQANAIVGDVSVVLTPLAATIFAQSNTIAGDVSFGLTPASALAYSQGATIIGDVSIVLDSNAGFDYNIHPEIAGDGLIGLLPSAGLVYQGQQNLVFAGDALFAFTPIATMTYSLEANLIPREVFTVPAENREFIVPLETREFIVPAEDRTFIVLH